MREKVLVRMKSTLTDAEQAEQTSTVVCHGELDSIDGGMMLTFNETLSDEEGHTMLRRTALMLRLDAIRMSQTGSYGFEDITFEPGLEAVAMYATPYGDMPMRVLTLEATHEATPHGGSILLQYQLPDSGTSACLSIDYRLKAVHQV